MAVLALDIVWGGVSHLIHFRSEKSHALSWSVINIAAILLMLGVITFPFNPKPLVLAAITTVRTVADYVNGRDFYFPKESPPTQKKETKPPLTAVAK